MMQVSVGEQAPPRQSLPSLLEVISSGWPKQDPPPARQHAYTRRSPLFATHSRLPLVSEKQQPRPLHAASFLSRQDAILVCADTRRSLFSDRDGPTQASNRLTARSLKPGRHTLQTGHELPWFVNDFLQPPQRSPQSHLQDQLPPVQMPLPVPQGVEPAPNKRFETWDYQESFSRISSHSLTIINFAKVYGCIVQELQASQPSPKSLPTECEVSEMLANANYIKQSLKQVHHVVQTSKKSEPVGKRDSRIEGQHKQDSDVLIYSNGIKPHYPDMAVTKRRRCTAPLGGCHSCHRKDSPEWRRGPDGFRTLCNACGLHYAKLQRRRELESRSPPHNSGTQLTFMTPTSKI